MSELRSEQIGQVAAALAAAQGEFLPINKNRTVTVKLSSGGSYSYDYATLDAILAAVRPSLAKNKLALVQQTSSSERGLSLLTSLIHASGEWLANELAIKPAQNPQELGSDLSYKRRYAISCLLAISADHDDDGNQAAGTDAQIQRKAALAPPQGANSPKTGKPTDEALKALRAEVVALERGFEFRDPKHRTHARMKYAGADQIDQMDEAGLRRYIERMKEGKKAAEDPVTQGFERPSDSDVSIAEESSALAEKIDQRERELKLSPKVRADLREEYLACPTLEDADLDALRAYLDALSETQRPPQADGEPAGASSTRETR